MRIKNWFSQNFVVHFFVPLFAKRVGEIFLIIDTSKGFTHTNPGRAKKLEPISKLSHTGSSPE